MLQYIKCMFDLLGHVVMLMLAKRSYIYFMIYFRLDSFTPRTNIMTFVYEHVFKLHKYLYILSRRMVNRRNDNIDNNPGFLYFGYTHSDSFASVRFRILKSLRLLENLIYTQWSQCC